ncbi:hypothetical protein [Actinomadura geliboluensis]|uniref:Uncharacterized protein n=1 Tax=Actinomadura geliboluensis TaxID=882440 RepID=A0A5S4H8Z2_9ACTN|nr:hypothetical protein [Actinomadura geliboluensis]TMR41703.1 hypothetical protein ETD96_04175 [Actinomadura geliboluensis]
MRARFGRWITYTRTRPYDERWLAYQQAIAPRHTWDKKNKTDPGRFGASHPAAPPRRLDLSDHGNGAPFLTSGGHDDQVEAMFQAWFKAVTLWPQPYTSPVW